MWPLLAEDEHREQAQERRRREAGVGRRMDKRTMILAGCRSSSRYCGCGKCSGVPNGSVLNNGWIVVEKEKVSLATITICHESMRCATSFLPVDCPLTVSSQFWTPGLWVYHTYGTHAYSRRLPEPLPKKMLVNACFQSLGGVGHRVYARMSSHWSLWCRPIRPGSRGFQLPPVFSRGRSG